MGQGDHSRESITSKQEQPPPGCSRPQERRGKLRGCCAGLVWPPHLGGLCFTLCCLLDILEPSQVCWSPPQEPLEHPRNQSTQGNLENPAGRVPLCQLPALSANIPALGEH